MENEIDLSRMTLRLPKELREALEQAAKNSTSRSVTAEIVYRLKKSLLSESSSQKEGCERIKQHATMILHTLDEMAKETSPVTRKKIIASLSKEECILLEAFNAIPSTKKKDAIESVLKIFQMLK